VLSARTVEEDPPPYLRVFAAHLQRANIDRVLEIGCRSAQFASELRRLGFKGTIYSAAADTASYLRLLAGSRNDPRWIPLARSRVMGEPFATQDMPGIEALAIEPGDDEAIDHHLPLIAHAQLLGVRRSCAVCGEATGDRCAADATVLAQVGLYQEPPLPSDGCGGNEPGTADQGCVIFSRPDTAGRAAPGSANAGGGPARRGPARRGAIKTAAVITSMGGTLQRRLPDGTDFGPEWFRNCLNSWRKPGCPVVSVAEIRPPDGIQWVKTKRRPSILQMLAGGTAQAGEHLLLTNADILLTDRFCEMLPELDPDVVYYANRVDVARDPRSPGNLTEKGVFAQGYDCFLMPAAFIKSVIAERLVPEEYCIGEPWWDYALPLAAVARGFPTKKLPWSLPLALHHVHPTRYSVDVYYRNGQLFLEFCESLLGGRPVNAAGLLGEVLADRSDFDNSLESVTKFILEALP
jgi:hypothetical protein